MQRPHIFVIILSYNGRHLTEACVRSCLDSDFTSFTIVLVDNASPDGSGDYLKEKFSSEIHSGKIKYIGNEANLGFAGGNNVGIQYALDNNADAVLLLNNDTVMDKKCLTYLSEGLAHYPQAGILGPKIYYFEPNDQIWFAGAEFKLYKGTARHIGIREKENLQYEEAKTCDYITGCAMLIRRDVFKSVPGLNTSYHMYSEDVDFCFRAKQAGFELMYIPQAKIWHKISASTGGQLSLRKIRLRFFSNMKLLIKYARWYHWLTIPFYFFADLMRIAFRILTGAIRN
ncbi:glycosyltransferase family 2 protein [bacterium]|nr:glycosyltransferase family 2 protein [bacterium]NUN44347.1 glycosyltransferase family 2 protein [bacterium]